jgi:hypothetical protein
MKIKLIIAALGVVLAVASGCGTKVVSGNGTHSGSTGTTGGNNLGGGNGEGGHSTSVGGGPAGTEVAIRWGDIPVDATGGTSVSTSVGGGTGPDPDSYEFTISDGETACASFWASPCGSWRVNFNIAPASLHVGAIIPQSEMNVTHTINDTGCNGTSAVGGGGGPGQAEILAIDASSISYRLTNIDVGDAINVDGDHSALICH